jgi:hypothetical protein
VGDSRIEAKPCDVEEQAAVDFAAIDRALHTIERDREGRFGTQRDPQLARESIPDPTGMMPSTQSRNAATDAMSWTVPSPPHAISVFTPRATAAAASSRA